MQRYAEQERVMKTPCRSLIGSMCAIRLLFATPLPRWCLMHGLKSDSQFANSPCFKPFGDDVSDVRRPGDVDAAKAIIADTMKLLGNSAYGKTVTNQEKHSDVKMCTNAEEAARRIISNPHLRALHTLEERRLCEV